MGPHSDPEYLELNEMLDSIPLPVVAIDQNLRVTKLNRAALHRSGASLEKAVGTECYRLLYGKETPCKFCTISASGDGSSRKNIDEMIHTVENGEEKTLHVRIQQVQGEQTRYIEMIEDVTSKVAQNEDAAQKEKLAAIGTMISGIAHELNNPLTGIGLTLQSLSANLSTMDTQEIQKRLNLLHKDMSRASRIVSDILTFASPGKGKFSSNDVVQLCQRAQANIQRLYPVLSRRIEWIYSGEERAVIKSNPEKLERLFINLFKNSVQAFDYAPGVIHIEIKKMSKWIHIIIEDNAGGIPLEKINQIFDPFYTGGRDGRGTGLGLTICHSIVKEHNGRIRARSFENKTKFYVSLPVLQDDAA